jgi:hypothetical protein
LQKIKILIPRERFHEEISSYLIGIDMRWRELKDNLFEKEDSKEAAKEKMDERLNLVITEALSEAGTPRVISDLMGILRNVSLRISAAGHGPLFILIDEFENSLPTSEHDRKRALRIIGRRRSATPQAINQLDSLTQLSGIGFVVVMRKEYWEDWKKSVENRVNKFEKSLTIELADFNKGRKGIDNV